jgi:glyoxylase-like metal-dependent hydrolase (beta-lactamase superfamily II)
MVDAHDPEHTEAGRTMRKRGRRFLFVLTAAWIALAVFYFAGFAAAPLPAPPPFAGAWPPAYPPPTMAVYQLPTGVTHRNAGFAYRGGSFFDKRDFAMTAVLVEHPRGDLIIDTGFGRDIDAQVGAMPLWFREMTRYRRDTPAADRLAAAHYDTTRLAGIILTHAHWDHVSGIPDFPSLPVLVTREEQAFIPAGGMMTVTARQTTAGRLQTYAFEGGPYLGFPKSHDVYGDGSIVIVPAPGHTPGSVVVFLSLIGGRHYALVGDLVWQLEGITEREERPWPVEVVSRTDRAGARANILHMAALLARFPDLIVVPSHDSRGFAKIPTF